MELQQLRLMKRVKQWDVALATGLSQSRISLIENGRVEARPHEKLWLSRALGLNPGDIDWKTPPSPSISIEDV